MWLSPASAGHVRLSLRVTAFALTLIAGACREAEPRPPTIVRDSAGVSLVDNDHTQPAWGRDEAWHLSSPPSIQVGNIPGNPDHQLYHVGHSLRLRDGSIAVANTGIGDVRLYNRDGFHVRTVAMPLGSSTASTRPLRLYELGGDTLLVFLEDRSVALFDRTGALLGRSPSLADVEDSTTPPELGGAFDDGTLLLRAWPPEDTTGTGVRRSHVRLLRITPQGEILGSLGDFPDQTLIFGEGVYVFGATGMQAASDTTVWFTSGDRFEILEVGLDGRTKRIVRLDQPLGDVMQTDIFALRQSALRQLRRSVDEDSARSVVDSYQYGEKFPPFAEIVVDDLGNVWLRSYQWFDLGANREWRVFDPEGRYLGDVITPSLLEPHHIGDDFVLGRMANDQGDEAVYLYRLEKPSPNAPS